MDNSRFPFLSSLLRRLTLAAGMFGSVCALYAQSPGTPIELSDRIGFSVDELEREYFGLFYGIEDYASAETFRGDGGVVVRIARRDGADTLLVMSNDLADRIGRYVERFEEYVDGQVPVDTSIWKVALPSRFFEDGVGLKVETIDGRAFQGHVLRAERRGLVMIVSPTADGFRRSMMSDSLVVVPAEEIDRVATTSVALPLVLETLVAGVTGLTFSTAAVDVLKDMTPLAGAMSMVALAAFDLAVVSVAVDIRVDGETDTWMAALPAIHQRSVFYAVEPPELRRFADSALAVNRPRPVPIETVRRFAVAASASVSVSDGSIDYPIFLPQNLGAGRQDGVGRLTARVPTWWSFALEYDALRWFALGLSLDYLTPRDAPETEDKEEVGELVVAAVGDVSLRPRRRLGPQVFDILFGVGLGVDNVWIDGVVKSPWSSRRQPMTQYSAAPVALARLTIRLNAAPTIAIQTSIAARWVGDVTVGDYSYYQATFDEPSRTVPSHGTSLSRIFSNVGIRFSF